MEKVYQGRFDYPGLWPGQRCTCLLRVYREPPDWKGPLVAIATEVADNPGASITNAVEHLATRVWQEFIPDKAHPPLLFDHYDSGSGVSRKGDEFSLVHFHELFHPRHGLGQWVAGPRWEWVPGSLVRRLVGDEDLGDGYDRKAGPVEPGDDWMEQEADA